jgi:hypothetical protein
VVALQHDEVKMKKTEVKREKKKDQEKQWNY